MFFRILYWGQLSSNFYISAWQHLLGFLPPILILSLSLACFPPELPNNIFLADAIFIHLDYMSPPSKLLSLIHFTILMIFMIEVDMAHGYSLRCNFPFLETASYIFRRIFFLERLSCSPLCVKSIQVSAPYVNTDLIRILYKNTLLLLDRIRDFFSCFVIVALLTNAVWALRLLFYHLSHMHGVRKLTIIILKLKIFSFEIDNL